MDVNEIQKSIKRVIQRHKRAFDVINGSQTKLLELGAITGIAEHYKSKGFVPRVVNPKGRRSFVVKTSTRGFPWNFSRIIIEDPGKNSEALCELHMNAVVDGAHKVGTYCVDVGVVEPCSIPAEEPPKKIWKTLSNSDLITFAEVKKLVVYPMLLAQFLGIVHEIKPTFLRGRKRLHQAHPSPTLIVLGHYSANSLDIVRSYKRRKIAVWVAANYDGRLARVRNGEEASPFASIENDIG